MGRMPPKKPVLLKQRGHKVGTHNSSGLIRLSDAIFCFGELGMPECFPRRKELVAIDFVEPPS
jgi:hypothetical protein